MAPLILVQIAEALREHGENKISTAARNEVEFIEQELGRARVQLGQSLDAIQAFKESQAFTSLSVQEQAVVNQSQEITRDEDSLEEQRMILSELTREIVRVGPAGMDLVNLEARLIEGINPQIISTLRDIQEQEDELAALFGEQRLTPEHPAAQAIRARIRERRNSLPEVLQANLRVVETRLQALVEERRELRERRRAYPQLEHQLQTLEMEQETDQVTYEYLLSQLYQARIMEAAAEPYVDILDRPVGATPVNPRGRINIFLGALLGLILGAGAAFFLEYLDRTIRTTADVEASLGVPVLGIIPRLRPVGETDVTRRVEPSEAPLVMALDPQDPAAESYRNLRMNLMFMSTEEDPIRTVLFTSPGPGEGKSTTALNFSVMLAQQGQRVLLLDADLRRPTLHKALDVLREPGLTNLLVGDAGPREAIRPSVLPNLDFLPTGPFPPNPSELLNSKAMTRLLEVLEGKI